ncbi:MAG: adenylate/guanylate cyclase domain-containing protein [Alphaproteobacteria bacterium]|nr:adenylate/guanylate cyclase domain-containing protein [Alphaproteobacteria bacterium]
MKALFSGMTVERRTALYSALIFVAVSLVSAAVSLFLVDNFSVLSRLDQLVQDWEVASVFAPREAQDSKIIIVAVDEATLSRFPYRSPIDREFLGTLIQQLAAHHPAAIASDFLLDQPTEQAKDLALAKTVRSTQVPLVISYISSHDIVTPEQKAFEDAMVPLKLRALANLPTDQFDTARFVFDGGKVDGHYIPGVARALAARVGIQTPAEMVPIIWHGRPEPTDTDSDPKPFKQVSATVAGFMPDSWYRDKIVLIGSDVTLVDRHRTPFSVIYSGDQGQLPGIVIQAHALSQLLNRKVSPLASWQLNFAITLALALLGATLGVIGSSLIIRAAAMLLFIPLFWAGGVALFHYANVMVGLMSPALAMVASFASMESLSGREARKQKAFIQGAFSRYVSPAIVDRMVADPSRMNLEGERREMTFLFSDIADFTTMSEQIDAIQLAQVLNNYLDGMTNLVMKHGGMVDKFIGDAVFAIFNAPLDLADHQSKAVRCMLEMDRFSQDYRKKQHAEGVPLGITRIGVHTGVAVVGNFGSHARFTYTASGDAVNTAARLEGINKYFGTRLCVSGVTKNACEGIAFRPIVSAIVKGKTEALDLWEPLQDGALEQGFLEKYMAAYGRMSEGDGSLFDTLNQTASDDYLVKLHVGRLKKGESGTELKMTEK